MIFDYYEMYHLLQQADWNAPVSMPGPGLQPPIQDGKLALRALAYRQMLFSASPMKTVIIYLADTTRSCAHFKNFTIKGRELRFLCMFLQPDKTNDLVRSGEGNGSLPCVPCLTTGKNVSNGEEQIDNVPGFRVALHEKAIWNSRHSRFHSAYKTSAEVTLFFFDIFYKTNEYKLREYKITNSTWEWISLASYLLSTTGRCYNATRPI
uniref:Uncharacterized protein n=1 Tax=Macrostomum lignano TaxID=282301 RepID=A0A1I8FJZ3_9PLAT